MEFSELKKYLDDMTRKASAKIDDLKNGKLNLNSDFMMKTAIALLLALPLVAGAAYIMTSRSDRSTASPMLRQLQQPYIDFMNIVFDHMDREYYRPVSRDAYEKFIAGYRRSHLSDPEKLMDGTGWLAHLGAGLMVQKLRDPEDTFTNFVAPADAEEYAMEVYGHEYGLGISGEKRGNVFFITDVEPRSNAYKAGILPGNAVMAINGDGIDVLSSDEINSRLFPPLGTEVELVVAVVEERRLETHTLVCEEFFKETIEDVPTGIPGAVYVRINRFNRETANDLEELMLEYGLENIEYLVLDVAGNPGGPPLAVREMAALFLDPGDRLVFYTKKGEPEFGLVTPDSEVRYEGRLMVIVDEKSGSSSEILAGVLQRHGRAIVMGTGNTAGDAALKSTIRFADGSMLALVTAESHIFDGTPLGAEGIVPNYRIPNEITDITAFVLGQIIISMQD